MASTKTWALLTQSLFISMVGAERFIARDLETSSKEDGADDIRAIFKENDNVVCGGTESHDALKNAVTIGSMKAINWERVISPCNVCIEKAEELGLEREKCIAGRAALEEFKQQMLVLVREIDDAFDKRKALADKVEKADEALEEMFDRQAGLTNLELELLLKLEEKVRIEEGLKAEMASIQEQESVLSASLSVVVGALKEATSKLDAAMEGTPEAGLKQLAETLTTKSAEMKQALDGLVAKKRSTGVALALAIEALGGKQKEVDVAKGDLTALNEGIEKAGVDGDTLKGLLDEAEQAYLGAKQAYDAMLKKGSNLAF